MYYEYREPAKTIPSHRMLAIRRGENENVLFFLIELEPQRRARACCDARSSAQQGDWTPQLELAIEDSWQRLLNSSIQAEIRLELKKPLGRRGDQGLSREPAQSVAGPAGGAYRRAWRSTRACARAARSRWSTRPASSSRIDVIYPHRSEERSGDARKTLETLDCASTTCRAIAIGNGTASRETDAFVREFLREAQAGRDVLRDGQRVRG